MYLDRTVTDRQSERCSLYLDLCEDQCSPVGVPLFFTNRHRPESSVDVFAHSILLFRYWKTLRSLPSCRLNHYLPFPSTLDVRFVTRASLLSSPCFQTFADRAANALRPRSTPLSSQSTHLRLLAPLQHPLLAQALPCLGQ